MLIEDDRNICQVVKIALEEEGFQLDVAHDGISGLELVLGGSYDLLLLDIMLPGKNGWEVCNYLRGDKSLTIPIIMLTARDDEGDRVRGLESGADDYICKPFSPREMIARVKAQLRRGGSFKFEDEISAGGELTIDTVGHQIKLMGHYLELPQMEYRLLEFFVKNKGIVFSREDLLRHIWKFEISGVSTRTVDEHIKRLRSRLSEVQSTYSYIQTVWKAGYRFEVKKID